MKALGASNRIPSLDGWRAIAIILVLFGHLHGAFQMNNVPIASWLAWMPGEYWAYEGVNMFFIISGFLITGILLTEWKQNWRRTIPKFYFKRIFRILPVYYLYLTVVFVLTHLLNWPITNREFFQSFFFLTNFGIWGSTIVLLHAWSLSIEEQFYLIWPIVLTLAKKVSLLRSTVIAVIVIAGISRIVVYNPDYASLFNTQQKIPFIAFNLLSNLLVYIDALMIGALASLFVYQKKSNITAFFQSRRLLNKLVIIFAIAGYIASSCFEWYLIHRSAVHFFQPVCKNVCLVIMMLYSIYAVG